MKFITSVVLLLALALAGCSAKDGPKPSTSAQFSKGQVWSYHARAGEESSRIIIGRVEEVRGAMAVHIKFIGVKIKSPSAPDGFSREIQHAPISEEALKSSVIELVGSNGDLTGNDSAHAEWASAQGGVFTVPAKKIVDIVEQTINGGGS